MIHRYDAPAGFVAVRGVIGTCSNCSYKNECEEPKYCCSDSRKDGESVMFKTRDEFEKMLLQELEQFYGVKITKPIGEVSGLLFFTVENPAQRIRTRK